MANSDTIYEYIGHLNSDDTSLEVTHLEEAFVKDGYEFAEKEKFTYEMLRVCKVPEAVLDASGIKPRETLEAELVKYASAYAKLEGSSYEGLVELGMPTSLIRTAGIYPATSGSFNEVAQE